jgi:hypothetical protein
MDEDDWYDRYYEDEDEQQLIRREPSRSVRGGGYWELRQLLCSATPHYDRPDEREYNATSLRPVCNPRRK